MASNFLSRSKKTDLFPVPDTGDVGPGEYAYSSIDKKVPVYSGFSSTSSRAVFSSKHGRGTQSPGVGMYSTRENLLAAGTPAVANFKSKADRWGLKEKDYRPGPSGFNPSSIKNLAPKKHLQSSQSFEFLEVVPEPFVVPSIPARHQSYGYEENPTGKLIPQAPINPGFTGTKNDTVGPGDYDPKLVRSKSAFDIGRGSARPDPAAAKRGAGDIPGPGYYNVPSAFGAPNDDTFYAEGSYMVQLKYAKNLPTATFRSKSDRGNSLLPPRVLKEQRPGPGSYQVPGAFPQDAPKREDLQCFSSSEQRFRDPQPRSQRIMVAPGAYTPQTSDFDNNKVGILKKKRMASRSDWAMAVSFDSTESRFIEKVGKSGPPPGAYMPKNTLADRVAKQRAMKSPWDSEQVRVSRLEPPELPAHRRDPNIMLDNKLLEPEGFKPINEWKPKNNGLTEKPKFTLPFASQVKRLEDPGDTLGDGPAPGTYNTLPSWKLKTGVKMIPDTIPVIKKKPGTSPGPGSYRPDKYGMAGSTNKRRNRMNVMIGTDIRFNSKVYEKDGPGPGVYNVTKSLLVPSHNVMLAAQ